MKHPVIIATIASLTKSFIGFAGAIFKVKGMTGVISAENQLFPIP